MYAERLLLLLKEAGNIGDSIRCGERNSEARSAKMLLDGETGWIGLFLC